MNKFFAFLFVFFFLNESCVWATSPQFDKDLRHVRDSLDQITMQNPTYKSVKYEKVIIIRNQEQFESLGKILSTELKNGVRNIEFVIAGKELLMPVSIKPIIDLDYPNANIRITGNKSLLVPEYIQLRRKDKGVVRSGNFWSHEYDDFDIGDIVVDNRGREMSLMSDIKESLSLIEKGEEKGDDLWKMQTDLPDLDENKCRNFTILITRIWTSTKHRIHSIDNGWLYFYDDSNLLQEGRGPNVDYILYGIHPRYQLINNPAGEGIHICNGRIFVPWKCKRIKVNKGGYLLKMSKCHFNRFEVTGFQLNNLTSVPIEIAHCSFEDGLYIHHNSYKNISSLAFATAWCKNVYFCDNSIINSRGRTIGYNATNFTICRNRFKNIGWLFNISAISGGGENLHICDNVIEDFNYSAISCGSYAPSRDSLLLTFIIERNLIKFSNSYKNNYLRNTLADGGAIYICPSSTQGIIRHNVIQNIKGINGNRGIFMDDGAKNLSVYGNLIVNTDNYYDIDLRLVKTYEKEIPDHNTNNSVFHNIMTGGYRFEDTGNESNCIGGQNILIGTGNFQINTVDIHRRVDDISINSCSITKDYRVVIPKYYAWLLNNISIDSFVKDFVVVK